VINESSQSKAGSLLIGSSDNPRSVPGLSHVCEVYAVPTKTFPLNSYVFEDLK
jgi:hypothetical protein